MDDEPAFEVTDRPERRYPATGGVEYEGETVFRLRPRPDRATDTLDALVGEVLADERYVRGDFFDLPAPVYLVRDAAVGTSFRVVVRDGRVELHVLPHTDEDGLRGFYESLCAHGDVEWDVEPPGGDARSDA